MKGFQFLLAIISAAILVVGTAVGASAILITPDTQNQWSGTRHENLSADDIESFVPFDGDLSLLYKQDVPREPEEEMPGVIPAEEGAWAPYYDTTFFNGPYEPEDATISWVGGDAPFISEGPVYLLVKDGNHDPYWYLFDLLNLYISVEDDELGLYSWNGTDDIELDGFWPNRGSISYVALFGTSTPAPVPEPATLLLFGTGLVGFAVGARRKMKKS